MELFQYLGDEICPGGGCELAAIARTRAAWEKFRELLPLHTSTTISLARYENYMIVVSEVLYFMLANLGLCGEKKCNVFCIAMLRWMLRIKAEDNVRMSPMYGRLNLAPLESKPRLNRLRWFGNVERSDKWINKCMHLEMDGFKGRGRPRKTRRATVTEDLKAWNINANNAQLRTAMKNPIHGNRGQVDQNG